MEKEAKQKVMKDFAIIDGDTGSADVQIALLTSRIAELSDHLKTHPKDNHSRKGLIGMVNRRRKFLKYLSRTNKERYSKILNRLKLRR